MSASPASRFADGSILACDMVVMAAGIKPNVEIASRCGLQVQRAIVVDNQMRSVTDPEIYVVGECAQHRGHVYGLVAPLWEQAKVLADHITGRDSAASYHGSKVATKLKVMGVEMAAMGIIEPVDERDEIVQFTEPKKGAYKKLIIRDGRLVGGILLGDISKAAYLMQAFDRGTPLPEERLSLLFDIGAPSKKVTVEEMPADMQVCNCNGVTKGAIVGCVKAGKRSPKAVMEGTRAGHRMRFLQEPGDRNRRICLRWRSWRKIHPFTTTCRDPVDQAGPHASHLRARPKIGVRCFPGTGEW